MDILVKCKIRYSQTIVVALLLGLINLQLLNAQSFIEQTGILLEGVTNSSVAWGDYDNDGNLDILLTGLSSNTTAGIISKIYRNNGDNTFTEQTGISLTGVYNSAVAWGDYNNDGYLDIILTGYTGSAYVSKIYKNNGDNTFPEQTAIALAGVSNGSVAWGDYDNDGYLDILLTGGAGAGSTSISKIYHNNGNNTFTEETGISLTGVSGGNAAWGDYDNDGYLDIVMTGSGVTKIYRNNGNGTFTEQTGISLPGLSNGSVAWGDYDNDGYLDILLVGKGSGYTSTVYRNNGNNTFTEQTGISLVNFKSCNVAWGDYDNDGYLDILIAGHFNSSPTGDSKVYHNNGDNTFIELTDILLPTVALGCAVWGDYDNDGKLDILLTGSAVSKIYRNYTSVSSTTASAPGNLQATINGSNVTFTWDKATDTETPQNGLSYNLYVYQDGQSTYSRTPHAFKKTQTYNGRRLIAQIGNIQYSSAGYTLKGLPFSSYKWSIQAVDGGLRGGSFASEASFASSILCNVGVNVANGQITNTTTVMSYSLNSTNGIDGTWTVCSASNTNVNFGTGGFDVWVHANGLIINDKRKVATIASQAAAPTYAIDYINEITNQNVATTDEYSVNADMSGATSGTGAQISVTPGQNLYFRTKATVSAVASAIQTLVVANRPATPTYSVDFISETTNEVVPVTDEYSLSAGLNIVVVGYISGTGVKIAVTPGQNLYFRVKATTSTFKSLVYTLIVPNRPTTPIYSIDFVNETTNENIAVTDEYSFNASMNPAYAGPGSKITVTPSLNLYFGVKATVTTFKSLVQILTVADRPATPTYSIDFINETTNENIAVTDEYSLNASMSPDSVGTGVKIVVTPGQNLYCRVKATASTFKSLVQNLTVANRPATPVYSINYINETTNENVLVSDEYSVNSSMSLASSGTGVKVAVTPSQNLYFRVKATASTFKSLVQTLLVPDRPATPVYSVDLANETTKENISVTDEYSANLDMSGAVSGTGVKITVTPGQNLYFRVKSTTTSFKSLIQTLIVPQIFAEQTGISLTGVAISSAAWGDYDNDGYLDILLTGLTSTGEAFSKIYHNNGNNTFTEQTGTSLIGVSDGSVAWGDYDNDGYLDILLTGWSGSTDVTKIYRNNGDRTFTEQTGISLPGVSMGSVAWGDCDNDGYPDILLTGSSTKYISKIFHNNGNNTFTELTGVSLTGVYNSSIAWGDYNNDGYLDILLIGDTGSARVSKVYRNNGDNTFTEQTDIALIGVSDGSIAWGDYDNDGYLDILLTGDTSSARVSKVYRNNGNNTFTEQTGILLTGVFNGSVAWGDYNNDGYLDILLTGRTGSIGISKIYRNNGNNTFTEQTRILLPGIYYGSAAWGDYDNDGNLDILLTGNSSSARISKVYHNNRGAINTVASAPVNLKATLQNGTDVTFTWDKATDNETPQNGLTYNLYVYKEGSSNYGRAPNAFAQTHNNGLRFIAQLGDIQYNGSGYTLRNLPSGNYKWSVQAIDGGLKGGSFAAEASFTFVNLSGVGVNVASNQITSTTIAMEYSINSTDGSNGIWTPCMASNTNLNFGIGGFDVWVRQGSLPTNYRKVATISAQASAPFYTIDYINETTNEIFLTSDEYSLNADMSGAISGVGKKMPLTPGQNLYFRIKATSSTVCSEIQLLVVPNRLPMPVYTIDYVNETTNEYVGATDEYSINLNMSNAIIGTGMRISVTPGQNLYFRTNATNLSFKSLVQTLVVQNRPATPTNPSVNDITNTFDWTNNQNFTSVSDYEFSTDNGDSWTTCFEKPINVGNVDLSPGVLQIRVKAADNSHFRSDALQSNAAFTTINTDIDVFWVNNINLYPNPVKDRIIIDYLTENAEVSIYSLAGILMKVIYLNINTHEIEVSDLPNGIYILKLQSNKIKGETKFVKQ